MTNQAPEVIAGIDTHADTHHVGLITSYGKHLGDREFLAVAPKVDLQSRFINSIMVKAVAQTGSARPQMAGPVGVPDRSCHSLCWPPLLIRSADRQHGEAPDSVHQRRFNWYLHISCPCGRLPIDFERTVLFGDNHSVVSLCSCLRGETVEDIGQY